MDDHSIRQRREGPLRRFEAGLGRPLPAPAGDVCESAGGAVPPRRLQPVSVEPVLDRCRAVPAPGPLCFFANAGVEPAAGIVRPAIPSASVARGICSPPSLENSAATSQFVKERLYIPPERPLPGSALSPLPAPLNLPSS